MIRVLLSALFVMVLLSLAVWAPGQSDDTRCPPVAPLTYDAYFRLDPGSDHGFLKQKLAKKTSNGTVAIYAIVPRGRCEFKNIFRGSDSAPEIVPAADEANRLARAQSMLASASILLSEQARTLSGFEQFLASAKEDLLAIVGDADDGLFRFPDGSTESVIKMARQCSSRSKRCLFISTVARDPQNPSSTGSVVSDEAVDLARELLDLHTPGADGSLRDLVSRIASIYPIDPSLSYSINFIVDDSGKKPAPVGTLIGFDRFRRPMEQNEHPIPINRPRPEYTDKARSDGVEGTVRVRLLVDGHGVPKSARVVKALPDGLTGQALKAVFQMRFKPATKAGVHVQHWVVLEVEFNLARRPH